MWFKKKSMKEKNDALKKKMAKYKVKNDYLEEKQKYQAQKKKYIKMKYGGAAKEIESYFTGYKFSGNKK